MSKLFASKVDYTVGSDPVGVAAADFNRDGKMDIVTVNGSANTVSILLGNGDGTFETQQTAYAVGISPIEVKVTDFNNDGKLDLVTTNYNSGLNPATVSVLLGKGDGTFAASVLYTVALGPFGVDVADFNRDGKPDIITADLSSNIVSVLLGNGDGTFATHVEYTVGVTYRVTAADFNRDGKIDIVTDDSAISKISISLGNGNGGFAAYIDYASGSGTPGLIAVADFNNDGKLDLVTNLYNGNTIGVLLGNGDGTFPSYVDYNVGIYPGWVSVADFNRDGKLDIVTTNANSNTVSVLLGYGNGTFAPNIDYAVNNPGGIALADFNNDGKIDIITTSGSNAISVLLNIAPISTSVTLASRVNYPMGTTPWGIVIADFNRDGKIDIATANNGIDTISVVLGNGDGTFEAKNDHVISGISNGLVVADFNRDGKIDIATTNYGLSSISVLLGNGIGGFTETNPNNAVGNAPFSIAVADFTNDGKVDIVTSNSGSTTISLLLGNGDGTFASATTHNVGSAPTEIAVADFNEDGAMDCVVSSNSVNTIVILLGNGDGTFQAPTLYTVGNGPYGVASADINDDGIKDIVTANQNANTASLLLGNGDGTFANHIDYKAGYSPTGVTIVDFNRDGLLDLILSNQNSNTISILLGYGNGTFASYIDYAVGATPIGIAAADFNIDGIIDITTSNSGANSISVLLGMVGPTNLTSIIPTTILTTSTSTSTQTTTTNVAVSTTASMDTSASSSPAELIGIITGIIGTAAAVVSVIFGRKWCKKSDAKLDLHNGNDAYEAPSTINNPSFSETDFSVPIPVASLKLNNGLDEEYGLNEHQTSDINNDNGKGGYLQVVQRAEIKYDNNLLNHKAGIELFNAASKDSKMADLLFELGQNQYYAKQILEAVQEQGSNKVLDTLRGVDTETMKESSPYSLSTVDTKLEQDDHQAPHTSYTPPSYVLSTAGIAVIKIAESKEAISYIFTEIIPVIDKTTQTSENSWLWTTAHLIGGLAFTIGLPTEMPFVTKIATPVCATGFYVLKEFYHLNLKPQLLDNDNDNNYNCLINIAADSIFGGATTLPFAVVTGNPIPIAYGMLQGGIIGSLSCYSNNNVQTHEESSGIANTLITAGLAYAYMQEMLSFNADIVSVQKAASVVTLVACGHSMIKSTVDNVLNYVGYNENYLEGHVGEIAV